MISLYYVRDLLQIDCFNHNYMLYADEKSLNRPIRWCYRLTSLDKKPFHLLGNEFFFLSSSILTRQDEYHFIQQLILSNCSGLCIDASSTGYELQRRSIDLCIENHFPIIIMNELVSIGILIPDINRKILEIQGNESESKKVDDFYQALLETEKNIPIVMNEENENGIPSLSKGSDHLMIHYLEILKEFTMRDVCYWHVLSAPISTNNTMNLNEYLNEERLETLDNSKENDVIDFSNCSITTIKVLNERYSYIILFGNNISNFDKILLLKLTSFLRTKVISAFIKRLQIQHSNNTAWIKQWSEGTIPQRYVEAKIKENYLKKKYKGYFVAKAKLPEGGYSSYSYRKSYEIDYRLLNDLYLQTGMLLFRAFFKKGFHSFQSVEDNILTYVFLIPDTIRNTKIIFEDIAFELNHNSSFLAGKNTHAAIGKVVDNIEEMYKSDQTATELLALRCSKNEKIIFYDLLDERMVIEDMIKQKHLGRYVEDTLKDLLNNENKDLLDTLFQFFLSNGEKKKTADVLNISRATLYSRLSRIEELTNKNLEDPHQRLSLFIALSGIKFLK